MRTIDPTGRFKRDLRRELKGRYRRVLADELDELLALLAADEPLAARHCDHALSGEWKDHRDCHVKPDLVLVYRKHHVKPDLVLVYRKPDEETLQLVRIGSHSKLGW